MLCGRDLVAKTDTSRSSCKAEPSCCVLDVRGEEFLINERGREDQLRFESDKGKIVSMPSV